MNGKNKKQDPFKMTKLVGVTNAVGIPGDMAFDYIVEGIDQYKHRNKLLHGNNPIKVFTSPEVKQHFRRFGLRQSGSALPLSVAVAGAMTAPVFISEYKSYKQNQHKTAEEIVDEIIEKNASRAWKRNFGNLSEKAVESLKNSKILDHEKELAGLIKGSENIAKKEGVTIKDFDPKAYKKDHNKMEKEYGVGFIPRAIDVHSETKAAKDSLGARTMTIKGKPVVYKGDTARSESFKQMLEHSNNGHLFPEEGSVDHRYLNAIIHRHELDEVRATNRLSNKFPDKYVDMANYHTHVAPSVLTRESANVAIAPHNVKKIETTLRGLEPSEVESLKNVAGVEYGKDAVVDTKKMHKTDDKYIKENGVSSEDFHKYVEGNKKRARDTNIGLGVAGGLIGSRGFREYNKHIARKALKKEKALAAGAVAGVGALALNHDKTAYEIVNEAFEKIAKEQILYHASPVQDIKKFRTSEDTSGNNKGEIIFASKEPEFAAAFGAKWNDGTAALVVEQDGKGDKPITTENFDGATLKVTDEVDLDKPASMYKLKGDFKNLRHKDDIECYTEDKSKVKVVEEEKFDTFRELARKYGLSINKVSEKYIDKKLESKKSYHIDKEAAEQDANDFNKDGKIPALEEAFKDNPLAKKVAYMIATSHEYKKPNVEAALSFVKNYDWELSTCKLNNMQGINKPVDEKKVEDMAKNMKTVKPFIVVNQFHGIRPQTPGKKILIDGHHRQHACIKQGRTEVPVYKGSYTGNAEKTTTELSGTGVGNKELDKKKTYAVDFDGTIVENEFPKIGQAKEKVIKLIRKIHSAGGTVIIWTCRSEQTLADAIKWLKDNNVPYDYINENPKGEFGSRKVYADYYIDDRAISVDDIDNEKVAEFVDYIFEKTARSLDAVRKKQFRHILKRVYGTDEAMIKGIQKNRNMDTLYHGGKRSNTANILLDGLKAPNSKEQISHGSTLGKGIYFTQNPRYAENYGSAVFALKKPSELKGTKEVYPPVSRFIRNSNLNKVNPRVSSDINKLKAYGQGVDDFGEVPDNITKDYYYRKSGREIKETDKSKITPSSIKSLQERKNISYERAKAAYIKKYTDTRPVPRILKSEIVYNGKSISPNLLKEAAYIDYVFEKMAMAQSKSPDTHLNRIKRAGTNKRMVHMSYTDKKGETTERLLEPYEIRGEDFWAYDPQKESIRRFKIGQINKVKVSDVKFNPRWDIKVGEYTPKSRAKKEQGVQLHLFDNAGGADNGQSSDI